ncbi:MAG: hypothetical protein C4308_09570 [Chitinophagaceae bacterium]
MASSSFSATFNVNGKKYEVLSCNYSFGQATDEKNRPASGVHGGNISITVVATDDTDLIGWMIDPYKKQDGSIVFHQIDQASTFKEVKFKDGYCVSYSEKFDSTASKPMTASFSISAREISVGDATHSVNW